MKSFKKNWKIYLVLANSIIAFITDIYVGWQAGWAALLLVLEIPLIYSNYKMLENKKWAFVVSTTFYFLASFFYESDDFRFILSNGVSPNIQFYKQFGINIIHFLMFILLITEFRKRIKLVDFNNSSPQIQTEL